MALVFNWKLVMEIPFQKYLTRIKPSWNLELFSQCLIIMLPIIRFLNGHKGNNILCLMFIIWNGHLGSRCIIFCFRFSQFMNFTIWFLSVFLWLQLLFIFCTYFSDIRKIQHTKYFYRSKKKPYFARENIFVY